MTDLLAIAILKILISNGSSNHVENHARNYARLIVAESERFSIDPWILVALIDRESSWRATAINETTGAIGLGQLVASPELLRGGFAQFEAQLIDPSVNLFLTVRWLDHWIARCGGNVGRALDAYNGRGISRRTLSPFATGILTRAEELRNGETLAMKGGVR